MNKKLIIIIVAGVLSLALLITGAVLLFTNAFGKEKGEPILTVATVEGKVGDTVTVPIKISNNPGFIVIGTTFTFNQEALEYVGFEKGNLLDNYDFNLTDEGLKFISLEDKDVKRNGTIVKLKFKITKKAEKSNEIGITLMSDGICDSETNAYTAKIKTGAINLK